MSDKSITEMCPVCESEITVEWDIENYGYEMYCPSCGNKMRLCDECLHAADNTGKKCDFDRITGDCFRTLIDYGWGD